MAVAQGPVTFTGAGSHSVRLGNGREWEREEVFPRYETVWRGETISVTMEASRYRYASGTVSDWRVFATGSTRPETTDLARSRMSDWIRPVVLAWLDSAEFAASRRAAFARSILHTLYEARPWENATSRTRDLVAQYRTELAAETADLIIQACDAFDAFGTLYRKAEGR